MINHSSIKYISELLSNPASISDGDISSISLFRQTFPYFVPVRYIDAADSQKRSAYSPAMLSNITPYLGNWLLFCEFIEAGSKGSNVPKSMPMAGVSPADAASPIAAPIVDVLETLRPAAAEIGDVAEQLPEYAYFIPEGPKAELSFVDDQAQPIESIIADTIPSARHSEPEDIVHELVITEEQQNLPNEDVAVGPIAAADRSDIQQGPVDIIHEIVPEIDEQQATEMPVPETAADAAHEELPQSEPAQIFGRITNKKKLTINKPDATDMPVVPVYVHTELHKASAPAIAEQVPENVPPSANIQHTQTAGQLPIVEVAAEPAHTAEVTDNSARIATATAASAASFARDIAPVTAAVVSTIAESDLNANVVQPGTAGKEGGDTVNGGIRIAPVKTIISDVPEQSPDTFVPEIQTPQTHKEEPLIYPVYTEDYFRHEGVKVPGDLAVEIENLRDQTEIDKSLMVVMSFTEWLLHFKRTSSKQKQEKTDQKALKTMWQKEKLAAAIEEENEEIPENVFEMAVNSIAKEDGLASESLADIYIKQEKYDKAIEMYRKLSLRNPKKNAYFARKIEEVLKLK